MNIRARLAKRLGLPPQTAATAENASHTITQLFRNPPQLGLLGRLGNSHGVKELRIAVWGVADGAEAVSLLVALDPQTSGTSLHVDGLDVSPGYIELAELGIYGKQHLTTGGWLPRTEAYLEPISGEKWRLRNEWRNCFHFEVGDLLAPPPWMNHAYDFVLCQNVLACWSPENARHALDMLAHQVRPDGWLVVGGGPLDIVPRHLLSLGFMPVLDEGERIHENWKVQRSFYNNAKRPPWALEPFNSQHAEGSVRYCTTFYKPKPEENSRTN